MNRIFKLLKREKTGGTSIEYGLIASLIAVGIITSVSMVGCQTNIKLWQVNQKVQTAK